MDRITGRRLKKAVVILCIAVLFFLFQMTYLGQDTYFTDENDNYIAALSLRAGGDIYSEYGSQHMPVLYYLCGIMHLLGARSVYQYRFIFALITAVLWTMMYLRYRTRIGSVAMVLGPIVYCGFINTGDLTYAAVLSDKLQAYGCSILFLEFLCYAFDEKKQISTSSSLWISFAILISFGSAFVAAFTIFWVLVCVAAQECREIYRGRLSIQQYKEECIQKYTKLIILVCAPFVFLVLWYLCTGNFESFFNGAYNVNRTIYPNYNARGYGSNILDGLLCAFEGYYQDAMSQVSAFTPSNATSWVNVGIIVVNLVFFFRCLRKDWLTGICVLIITCQSAPRRLFGFHAISHYLLSAYMAGILFGVSIRQKRCAHKAIVTWLHCLGSVALLIIFLWPAILKSNELFRVKDYVLDKQETQESRMIAMLTEPKERVGLISAVIDNHVLVKANRPPFFCSSGAPWMYEMFGEKEYQRYQENPPRVVVYTPGYSVWEYAVKDYAGELIGYIEEHYDNLVNNIWIRKDYTAQAEEETGLLVSRYSAGNPTGICEYDLLNVPKIKQYFMPVSESIRGISIMLGTHMRISDADIQIKLIDPEAGEVLAEEEYSLREAYDNSYFLMPFDCDGLSVGKRYCFEISGVNMNTGNAVVCYVTNAAENQYAVIAEEEKDYSICFKLH